MIAFLEWLKSYKPADECEAARLDALLAGLETQSISDLNLSTIRSSKQINEKGKDQLTHYYGIYEMAVLRRNAEPDEAQPPDWARTVHGLVRGGLDAAGNKVVRIFVVTDKYAIYSADDEKSDYDVCSLHYAVALPYDQAVAFRKRLIPVAEDIAWITDTVCSLKPPIWQDTRYESNRERACELMARAMAFALDDSPDEAQKILKRLRVDVEARRDSNNRMRYIAATTISFITLLCANLAYKEFGWTFLGEVENSAASVEDVLLFGALGAFFSVIIAVNRVQVAHAISLAEMIYAGLIRIPVGIIAAAAVILLISGKWMLASIGDDQWNLYLFGFIAGFSEMFVPNALNKAQDAATLKAPAARAS